MSEFRVGDRVRVRRLDALLAAFGLADNDIGTVVIVDDDPSGIGVAWDRNIGGHDLYGRCTHGHGYWMRASQLAIYNDEQPEEQFEPVTEDELFRALLEK